MDALGYASSYLAQVRRALDNVPLGELERAICEIRRAHERGSQVIIFGNGGSAATASHFACDLGKGTVVGGRQRLRVISLTDNVPLITAWANDVAYDNVFVEQLASLVQSGDVVIGISCSGNSRNVLKALEYARRIGAVTIAFTGFNGGQAKDVAEIAVVAPCNHMGRAEDVHLILTHIVSYYLIEQGQ